MGRTSKETQRKIRRYRKQGFTIPETAKKTGVSIRIVNKYDISEDQKAVRPAIEDSNQFEESCNILVAEGLLHKASNGRFCISFLGRRLYARFEELERQAILEFLAEAKIPVAEENIERHLEEITSELFDQALDEVKRRYN